jgi:DNA polymerase-3 subunit epsilon
LPYTPGVYYFHDAKGKVIYVGKAKCLKKRVVSHFTGLDTGKKRQEFLKNIHSITFHSCPTEFTASILESIEIKRLWPAYNYSQKKYDQLYGIYFFEDTKGYIRLGIDKKRKYLQPLALFNMMTDAYRTLWQMVKQFELHPSLCFLDRNAPPDNIHDVTGYNAKVREAIACLQSQNETFVIKEEEQNVSSYILIEEGRFYGMGTLSRDTDHTKIDELKLKLTAYPENEVVRSMIRNYVERYPANVLKVC